MITRMGILRKSTNLSVDEFRRHWAEVHGPIAARHITGLLRYHQNHIVDSVQRGIEYQRTSHEVDGFSQLWFESTESMQQSINPEVLEILDEDEKQFIGQLSLITVKPNIIVPVTSGKSLIKRMSILKRRPDIDSQTFKQEWADVHAEYVKKLPGIQGYIQNHIIDSSIKRKSSVELVDAQIDGIVEMWFEDIETLEQAFQSEAGEKCMEHAKTFISEISTYLVEARIIIE